MEQLIGEFVNARPVLTDIIVFLDSHPAGQIMVLYGPLLIGFSVISFLTRRPKES